MLVTELLWEKSSNLTRPENFYSRALKKEIGQYVRTRSGKLGMLTCLGQLYSCHSSTKTKHVCRVKKWC